MFKMNSIDGLSTLKIEKKELEKRYPSISLKLEINDRGFSGSLSEVWIDWENIEEYLIISKDYAYKDTFCHTFKSMSPNELEIKLQKVNPEICNIKYELNKIAYGIEPILLRGSFDIGIDKLEELRKLLRELREQIF